ncbi:MAG: peptidoglycan DD-metalloendopeptidase family protein [Alphaproteobacteria bacterium]|nr:peptidoglycan DD-metalloendopeptidase family protein [Alphaproteobacteria bacterium]
MQDEPQATGLARFRVAVARALIDREIILRTDGRIRFVKLSRAFQVAVAAPVILVLATALWVSVGYVRQDSAIAGRDVDLARARSAYLDLLADAAEQHEQFARIVKAYEDNQAALLGAIEQSGALRRTMGELAPGLKKAEVERANAALLRDTLRRRLAAFEAEIGDGGAPQLSGPVVALRERLSGDPVKVAGAARDALESKVQELRGSLATAGQEASVLKSQIDGLRTDLRRVSDERERLSGERDGLNQRLGDMRAQLASARERASAAESQRDSLQSSYQSAVSDRDSVRTEREKLRTTVAKLEGRLGDLTRSQSDLLDRIADRAKRTASQLERSVTRTGIDLERFFEEAEGPILGQGGPFVPAVGKLDLPKDWERAVMNLDVALQRWDTVQRLLAAMPLMPPIVAFEINSGFGKRIDPFNRQPAMHYGVDFQGPVGTPIVAPNAGVVSFSGWKGNYGRTVEIDHGMGIVTRYGHMSKVLVDKGDRVQALDKIGLIGNSGRSTGPHLHYEVLINGRAYDPMRFLTAARHVLKN